jgi:putative inorganic carbon (hco3(-)) transporter
MMRAIKINLTNRGESPWAFLAQAVLVVAAGGLAALVVLITTEVSLAGTAVVVLLASGLAFAAVIGEVRRPLLAVLAFTIPLHLDVELMWISGHQGGPSGFILTISDVVLLILICLWLSEITLEHRSVRFFPAVSVPALVFIAIGLICALTAPHPIFSAFQLFQFAKGFVLYFYLANRVLDERDAKWILGGLMLAIVFQSSLGMYQTARQRPLGLWFLGEVTSQADLGVGSWQGVRPQGTLFSPTIFSMYLGMAIPVILSFVLSSARRNARLLAACVVLIGLVANIYTLTRGGWVGTILSTVTLLLLYPKGQMSGRFHRLLVAVPAVSVLVLVLDLITNGTVIRRLTAPDRGAALGRIPLMRGALSTIANHPILGTGLGNYQFIIKEYDPTGGLTRYASRGIVHNSFLLLTAETGVFGLGAFLWLLIALGWRGLAFLKQRGNGLATGLTAGLLASGVHLVVHSMVDYTLFGDPQLFMFFWLLGGLLVALTAQSDRSGAGAVLAGEG